MGGSAKRKREKAQDFKKAKLKVGKTPRKPDNFTDTSFRSKAIVLSQQSLSTSAPSSSQQASHHISLLSHHSSSVRRDSLSYLTTHLRSSPTPPPAATILPKLAALILDASSSVRSQLLSLLAKFEPDDARVHLRSFLLHIYSAMSHIDNDIRGDSTKFLSWALRLSPVGTLADGGWVKGMTALSNVLAQKEKNTMQHMECLKEFVEAGMTQEDGGHSDEEPSVPGSLHWSTALHLKRPMITTFSYLGLFADGKGGDASDDVEGRKLWMGGEGKAIVGRLYSSLDAFRKEGGVVGRAAGRVYALLENASQYSSE